MFYHPNFLIIFLHSQFSLEHCNGAVSTLIALDSIMLSLIEMEMKVRKLLSLQTLFLSLFQESDTTEQLRTAQNILNAGIPRWC